MAAKITWHSHLKDDKEKQQFLLELANSKGVLRRLETLVEESHKTSYQESHKREGFGNAAWPYKQAYEMGVQSALDKVLALIRI